MEFDELTKIWHLQNKETMYVIDASALHRCIQAKKRQAKSILNISELLNIIVNIFASVFIITINFLKDNSNIFLTLVGIWMFCTALYVALKRIGRLNGDNQFDQSMRGDLDHAISVATYQIKISHLMRWNVLPVGLLLFAASMNKGQSFWIAVSILSFFFIAIYVSRWEHNIYKSKRNELEVLRKKLENK